MQNSETTASKVVAQGYFAMKAAAMIVSTIRSTEEKKDELNDSSPDRNGEGMETQQRPLDTNAKLGSDSGMAAGIVALKTFRKASASARKSIRGWYEDITKFKFGRVVESKDVTKGLDMVSSVLRVQYGCSDVTTSNALEWMGVQKDLYRKNSLFSSNYEVIWIEINHIKEIIEDPYKPDEEQKIAYCQLEQVARAMRMIALNAIFIKLADVSHIIFDQQLLIRTNSHICLDTSEGKRHGGFFC
jgi:hypothetical protein